VGLTFVLMIVGTVMYVTGYFIAGIGCHP